MSSCQLPDDGEFCRGVVLVFPGSLFCACCLAMIIKSTPFHSQDILIWMINFRVTLVVYKGLCIGGLRFYIISNMKRGPLICWAFSTSCGPCIQSRTFTSVYGLLGSSKPSCGEGLLPPQLCPSLLRDPGPASRLADLSGSPKVP